MADANRFCNASFAAAIALAFASLAAFSIGVSVIVTGVGVGAVFVVESEFLGGILTLAVADEVPALPDGRLDGALDVLVGVADAGFD